MGGLMFGNAVNIPNFRTSFSSEIAVYIVVTA